MTVDTPARRIPIVVPHVGTGHETIRVSAWLVDVGQTVIAGDNIVEILIPGITFDVSVAETGELVEITQPVDAIVQPGMTLGWISVE